MAEGKRLGAFARKRLEIIEKTPALVFAVAFADGSGLEAPVPATGRMAEDMRVLAASLRKEAASLEAGPYDGQAASRKARLSSLAARAENAVAYGTADTVHLGALAEEALRSGAPEDAVRRVQDAVDAARGRWSKGVSVAPGSSLGEAIGRLEKSVAACMAQASGEEKDALGSLAGKLRALGRSKGGMAVASDLLPVRKELASVTGRSGWASSRVLLDASADFRAVARTVDSALSGAVTAARNLLDLTCGHYIADICGELPGKASESGDNMVVDVIGTSARGLNLENPKEGSLMRSYSELVLNLPVLMQSFERAVVKATERYGDVVMDAVWNAYCRNAALLVANASILMDKADPADVARSMDAFEKAYYAAVVGPGKAAAMGRSDSSSSASERLAVLEKAFTDSYGREERDGMDEAAKKAEEAFGNGVALRPYAFHEFRSGSPLMAGGVYERVVSGIIPLLSAYSTALMARSVSQEAGGSRDSAGSRFLKDRALLDEYVSDIEAAIKRGVSSVRYIEDGILLGARRTEAQAPALAEAVRAMAAESPGIIRQLEADSVYKAVAKAARGTDEKDRQWANALLAAMEGKAVALADGPRRQLDGIADKERARAEDAVGAFRALMARAASGQWDVQAEGVAIGAWMEENSALVPHLFARIRREYNQERGEVADLKVVWGSVPGSFWKKNAERYSASADEERRSVFEAGAVVSGVDRSLRLMEKAERDMRVMLSSLSPDGPHPSDPDVVRAWSATGQGYYPSVAARLEELERAVVQGAGDVPFGRESFDKLLRDHAAEMRLLVVRDCQDELSKACPAFGARRKDAAAVLAAIREGKDDDAFWAGAQAAPFASVRTWKEWYPATRGLLSHAAEVRKAATADLAGAVSDLERLRAASSGLRSGSVVTMDAAGLLAMLESSGRLYAKTLGRYGDALRASAAGQAGSVLLREVREAAGKEVGDALRAAEEKRARMGVMKAELEQELSSGVAANPYGTTLAMAGRDLFPSVSALLDNAVEEAKGVTFHDTLATLDGQTAASVISAPIRNALDGMHGPEVVAESHLPDITASEASSAMLKDRMLQAESDIRSYGRSVEDLASILMPDGDAGTYRAIVEDSGKGFPGLFSGREAIGERKDGAVSYVDMWLAVRIASSADFTAWGTRYMKERCSRLVGDAVRVASSHGIVPDDKAKDDYRVVLEAVHGAASVAEALPAVRKVLAQVARESSAELRPILGKYADEADSEAKRSTRNYGIPVPGQGRMLEALMDFAPFDETRIADYVQALASGDKDAVSAVAEASGLGDRLSETAMSLQERVTEIARSEDRERHVAAFYRNRVDGKGQDIASGPRIMDAGEVVTSGNLGRDEGVSGTLGKIEEARREVDGLRATRAALAAEAARRSAPGGVEEFPSLPRKDNDDDIMTAVNIGQAELLCPEDFDRATDLVASRLEDAVRRQAALYADWEKQVEAVTGGPSRASSWLASRWPAAEQRLRHASMLRRPDLMEDKDLHLATAVALGGWNDIGWTPRELGRNASFLKEAVGESCARDFGPKWMATLSLAASIVRRRLATGAEDRPSMDDEAMRRFLLERPWMDDGGRSAEKVLDRLSLGDLRLVASQAARFATRRRDGLWRESRKSGHEGMMNDLSMILRDRDSGEEPWNGKLLDAVGSVTGEDARDIMRVSRILSSRAPAVERLESSIRWRKYRDAVVQVDAQAKEAVAGIRMEHTEPAGMEDRADALVRIAAVNKAATAKKAELLGKFLSDPESRSMYEAAGITDGRFDVLFDARDFGRMSPQDLRRSLRMLVDRYEADSIRNTVYGKPGPTFKRLKDAVESGSPVKDIADAAAAVRDDAFVGALAVSFDGGGLQAGIAAHDRNAWTQLRGSNGVIARIEAADPSDPRLDSVQDPFTDSGSFLTRKMLAESHEMTELASRKEESVYVAGSGVVGWKVARALTEPEHNWTGISAADFQDARANATFHYRQLVRSGRLGDADRFGELVLQPLDTAWQTRFGYREMSDPVLAFQRGIDLAGESARSNVMAILSLGDQAYRLEREKGLGVWEDTLKRARKGDREAVGAMDGATSGVKDALARLAAIRGEISERKKVMENRLRPSEHVLLDVLLSEARRASLPWQDRSVTDLQRRQAAVHVSKVAGMMNRFGYGSSEAAMEVAPLLQALDGDTLGSEAAARELGPLVARLSRMNEALVAGAEEEAAKVALFAEHDPARRASDAQRLADSMAAEREDAGRGRRILESAARLGAGAVLDMAVSFGGSALEQEAAAGKAVRRYENAMAGYSSIAGVLDPSSPLQAGYHEATRTNAIEKDGFARYPVFETDPVKAREAWILVNRKREELAGGRPLDPQEKLRFDALQADEGLPFISSGFVGRNLPKRAMLGDSDLSGVAAKDASSLSYAAVMSEATGSQAPVEDGLARWNEALKAGKVPSSFIDMMDDRSAAMRQEAVSYVYGEAASAFMEGAVLSLAVDGRDLGRWTVSSNESLLARGRSTVMLKDGRRKMTLSIPMDASFRAEVSMSDGRGSFRTTDGRSVSFSSLYRVRSLSASDLDRTGKAKSLLRRAKDGREGAFIEVLGKAMAPAMAIASSRTCPVTVGEEREDGTVVVSGRLNVSGLDQAWAAAGGRQGDRTGESRWVDDRLHALVASGISRVAPSLGDAWTPGVAALAPKVEIQWNDTSARRWSKTLPASYGGVARLCLFVGKDEAEDARIAVEAVRGMLAEAASSGKSMIRVSLPYEQVARTRSEAERPLRQARKGKGGPYIQ